MDYRAFGQTGFQVSVFTLGTMRLLHGWDPPHDHLPNDSLDNTHQIITTALNAGINLIETARAYGKSERLIGHALTHIPQRHGQDYAVMTKATFTQINNDGLDRCVEESRERLGVNAIDFFALHGINLPEQLEFTLSAQGPLARLQQLKERGVIRHIGFSTHAPLPLILETLATRAFDFVNLHLQTLRPDNQPAVALAQALNMGVFIISPNDKGGLLYTPPPGLRRLTAPLHPVNYNERWLLSQPGVHTLSIGMSEPEHLAIHMKSLTPRPLWGNQEREIKARMLQIAAPSPLQRCGACTACLPCPHKINIPDVLRLLHLGRVFGMDAFGRYRYAEMQPDDPWMPGAKANRCDQCGECLPRCPQLLEIPALLSTAHERLDKAVDVPAPREETPLPLLDQRLTRALVEMTGEMDDISLTHALIRKLNIFILNNLNFLTPIRNLRFLEARNEAQELGKREEPRWSVLDPLDPERKSQPLEEIDGLQECQQQGEPVTIPLDNGVRAVYPVLVGRFSGFLVIDGDRFPPEAAELVEFFLTIYRNQAILIHTKERDPLTGLYNRHSFDEKINKLLHAFHGSAQRKGDHASKGGALAVLDIDHFKRVNDTFGHLMGDEVLLLFARLMERNFRQSDHLFRFGGEEFVVLLTGASEEESLAALERMRRMVENYLFPQVGQVTVSIGCVTIQAGEVPTTLIGKADQALYHAKNHGRNQVRHYQELVQAGLIARQEFATNDIEMWD